VAMDQTLVELIAARFTIMYVLDKEVRAKSHATLRLPPDQAANALAELINNTVRPPVAPATAADIPAIRAAIRAQIGALPQQLLPLGDGNLGIDGFPEC